MIEPDMALLVGEENKIYDPIIYCSSSRYGLSLEHVDASFALTRRSKDAAGISSLVQWEC